MDSGAYGGVWIENSVQAIARDLFAAAMPRLEAAGYRIVLHVHDEICCEVSTDFGSPEEFQRILTTAPSWAEGLPIAAKVRVGDRFCKISKVAPAEDSPPTTASEEDPAEEDPAEEEPAEEDPAEEDLVEEDLVEEGGDDGAAQTADNNPAAEDRGEEPREREEATNHDDGVVIGFTKLTKVGGPLTKRISLARTASSCPTRASASWFEDGRGA